MKEVNLTHIFNLKFDAFQNPMNLMPIEQGADIDTATRLEDERTNLNLQVFLYV